MNAVYHHKGVAHEITAMSHVDGIGFVTIRCGASLSPYVGAENIEDNAPVTCLFCISGVTKETHDAKDEDAGDGWSSGVEAASAVELHPFWDGRLMHLAEWDNFNRFNRLRCQPPWSPMIRGQIVGNATPTCLWCIVDRRYA